MTRATAITTTAPLKLLATAIPEGVGSMPVVVPEKLPSNGDEEADAPLGRAAFWARVVPFTAA